jgi:hypothetical protein
VKPNYGAKIVPAATLGEPGPLEGAQLVLPGPLLGLTAGRRAGLLMFLTNDATTAGRACAKSGASHIPRGGAGRGPESECAPPRAYSIEELGLRLGEAVLATRGTKVAVGEGSQA